MTLPGAASADRAAQVLSGNDLNWSVDAVLAVDSRGIVRLTNRRAEELFGYTSDEMVGRPAETFVRAQVTARGQYPAGLRKDGTEFPLQIALTSVATDEGMLFCASVSDASARASGGRHRHPPRPVPKALSRETAAPLSATAAHDINNLLAGIVIYADLVGESLRGQMGRGEVTRPDELNALIQDLRQIEDLAMSIAEIISPRPGDTAVGSTVPRWPGEDDDPLRREFFSAADRLHAVRRDLGGGP